MSIQTIRPINPHVERAVKIAVDSLRQANQQAETEEAMKLSLKDQIDQKVRLLCRFTVAQWNRSL